MQDLCFRIVKSRIVQCQIPTTYTYELAAACQVNSHNFKAGQFPKPLNSSILWLIANSVKNGGDLCFIFYQGFEVIYKQKESLF